MHDAHNDYPLAPERKLVNQEMLSPYALELQQRLKIGRDVSEKLVPNLEDKVDYVIDIRNLKFYAGARAPDHQGQQGHLLQAI